MRTLIVLVTAALALTATAAEPDAVPRLPASAEEALVAFRKVDHAAAAKPRRGKTAAAGWEARSRAAWELAAVASDKVPALAALLQDDDRHVRALAASSIGIAGGPDHGPLLVAALEAERNDSVRSVLVGALARTGGDGALEAVEAQQKPGVDQNLQLAIGMARRQLKGGRWDIESIRAEYVEACRTQPGTTQPGTTQPGAPERGKPAPEIALPSFDGPVNLSTMSGSTVLVIFTHGDRATHGVRFLQRLASRRDQLEEWGVRVVVVDPHEKERTKAWAERLRLPFTVCSDPAGRAQAAYGVARQLYVGGEWLPSPTWVLINKQGQLSWSTSCPSDKDQPALGTLLPLIERVKNMERIED